MASIVSSRPDPAGNSRWGPLARRVVVPLALIVAILWMEGVLRAATEGPFLNEGLVLSGLFAVTAALALHLVSGFFGRIGRRIVVGVGLGITGLLYASQLVYFHIFRTFYSAYSASKAGQVAEFAGDISSAIATNALLLVAMLLPPVVLVVGAGHVGPVSRPTWRQRGVALLVLLLCHGAALALINLGDREPNSPYDLYYRNSYPVASVNQLGLLTTMRLDVTRSLIGWEPGEVEPPPPDTPSAPDEPAQPGGGTGSRATAHSAVESNVLDIDFAKLGAATSDKKLQSAHAWFGQRKPTAKNEHTGTFKGYNLIFLTAEGYSHYAVDKKVTPTLYKMTHEGMNFTDFYNPIWGVSTSDGEYVATTGLIPKSGVWSMAKSGVNAMPYAMGNQLKPLGYKTMAYHDHSYDYYDRHISHPNLGYTYKGVGNGLKVKKTWPESDVEMMKVTVDEYVHDQPFHAYYMTVSGHLRYNFGGNFIAKKNQNLVADLPYGDAGKAYMATQIELDRALELLFKELEKAGVAEKTLIVLGADHYPYGLEKADIDNLAGHEVEPNFELYKSSLLVYAKGMKPVTVDRPVSSLDILPTVSNLMGVKYDSRLLMGSDVFSDADPLVIFNNRSFISDRGRYNSQTREFTPNPGVTVPEGYRKKMSAEIDRRFYYSALILDKNYYATVKKR